MTGMFEPLTEEEIAAAPRIAPQQNNWSPIVPPPASVQQPPNFNGNGTLGSVGGVWEYRDQAGVLEGYVVRFDTQANGQTTKTFRPCRYGRLNGKEGWQWRGWGDNRPLYQLPDVLSRDTLPILVCEGEKAASSAANLFTDFAATSPMNGAQSPAKTDWSPVRDRVVCVWPDHDEPGRGFAERVAQLCNEGGAASVRVVEVPSEFPEKWDLGDPPPSGWDVARLRGLLEAAAPSGAAPAADIERPRIDTGAGGELSPADEQLLSELAGLSLIEYDRRREEAAAELGGIRVSTLDQEIARRRPRDAPADDGAGSTLLFEEYDAWPGPVNGGELLERLRSTVERYAIMPAGSEIAIPLWVLFAHTHNYHPVSPILGIFAPDSECGKTTALNTVSWLVPKALPSSGASPATVYRVIEDCQPTLLTDELDSLSRETADALRGIYNSGHTRRLAYIMRMVKAGDDMEVRRFSTWAPKAIAQIGKPATTILSRSIVIWMQRKKPGQDIEKLPVDGTAELVDLHRMCLRWAGDHGQQLLDAAPKLPAGMGNRLADNWTPLFAIADLIGGPWPKQARDAAEKLSGVGKDDTSKGIQVLRDIREIFSKRVTNRIASQDLCDALHEHDDKWAEYSRGKPLSPTQLSRLLKPYGPRPKSLRLDDDRNVKGYGLESFGEAFDRYLPPAPPSGNVTPSQPKHTAALDDFQAVTSPSDVTDGNGRKAAENLDCDGVTGQIPLPRDEQASEGFWEEDL